jgi:hypothetical protein
MSENYDERMIEAFINKADKTKWYQEAFSNFNINGIDVMKWKWSWWAFFCGFLYLLYRKTYLPALVLFLLTIIANFIPVFGGLILMILSGGYSAYFVYRTYKVKKLEIESKVEDEEKRIETMKHLGGYNQWVVWVYAVILLFSFAGIIFAILLPLLES